MSQIRLPAEANPSSANASPVYRACVWLLIVVATTLVVLRILACESPDPNRRVPFFSANDRSRWCTIRALVDDGTFAIDNVIQGQDGKWWDTIDKVRHADRDGQMHYYSSKPPLWPVFLAGQYWVLKEFLGLSFQTNTFEVVRTILIVNNALGLALLIWLMGRVAERLTDDLFARLFVVTSAAFATGLTTFTVTLNNHLPAAVMVAASLWCLILVWRKTPLGLPYAGLGFGAALAASLELPALGWLALCLFCGLIQSFRRTMLYALPCSAIVAAGFFGANYWAHGNWQLPYENRQDGKVLLTFTGDLDGQLDQQQIPESLLKLADDRASNGAPLLTAQSTVVAEPGINAAVANRQRRWVVNRDQADQLVITRSLESNTYQLREWSNWYDYPGSYWLISNDRKSDVDLGESNPMTYLFNMTVGHHGVISLTPIFLLSILGCWPLWISSRYRFGFPTLGMIGLTLVIFYFYDTRPAIDRNYGGMTSVLRWVMWLYPIWLIWMIPTVESAAGKLRFWVLLVLLAISVASAGFAVANPWVHPWLFQWLEWRGLLAVIA